MTLQRDTVCQICGEKIAPDDVLYCCCCATAHHEDCWQYAEHCSTYACPGTEATKDYAVANEAAATFSPSVPIPTKNSGKAISLVNATGENIDLLKPVVKITVENGVLVIDNKAGIIRHRSLETEGLSAFNRIIPIKTLAYTNVVQRHSKVRSYLGSVKVHEMIPTLVTEDGHFIPITEPIPNRMQAETAAKAVAALFDIPYEESDCNLVNYCEDMAKGPLIVRETWTFFVTILFAIIAVLMLIVRSSLPLY